MLYALAHPAALLVLLVSFVLGITLHAVVQQRVAALPHGRTSGHTEGHWADPRRYLDPFGAVAAAISGLGWGRPVPFATSRGRGRRARLLLVGLSGAGANVILGLGLLVGWRAAYGPPSATGAGGLLVALVGSGGAGLFLQHGASMSGAWGSTSLFLAGCSQLYLGVLSLVPLPPLDGGRLMLALAPRTHGWQQAEYQLVERNIGVAALLVLLLLPLGGSLPLLPRLLDILLAPVIAGICGG